MDDGRAYLTSFASEGLGVAPHLMTGLSDWFDNTAAEMAKAETEEQPDAGEPEQAQPAQPAQLQPPAQPAPVPPAGPSRQQAHDRIAEIEGKYMRAKAGTPEYAAYWLGESGQRMQQEYRDLVTARETTAEPSPAAASAAPALPPAPAS